MEFEENDHGSIPTDILNIIKEGVERSVAPLREDDPWTAELDSEYELDCKKSQYLFLTWLKNIYPIESALYAGSGDDILPKIVFGEEKVIHVSMENYNGWETIYFPELGSGMKLVADNIDMPFLNSSFDMVMFFGLFIDSTTEQIIEAARVLRNDGLIICDDTITRNIDVLEILDGFESVEVPEIFQSQGISETNFAVFRKNIIR
jgi:hypothetical protein